MAAGNWVMPDATRIKLLNGTLDIDDNSWKIALILEAENLTVGDDSVYSDFSHEHANEHGYTREAKSVTLTLSNGATVKVDMDGDAVWTADSGSILAKWAAIYKADGAKDILVFCLLEAGGDNVEATDGNTLTVEAHGDGVVTLA